MNELRRGVEPDVVARNKILTQNDQMRFEVKDGRDLDSFTVMRHSQRSDSVYFYAQDNAITVLKGMEPFLQGSITLNDAGECRLKVKDVELEFWQFRRRALEELFRF